MGTKRIIEKYIEEVKKCVKTIYEANPKLMNIETKLEFFAETRHAYGRTCLMLSGGANFGRFHFGLLKALYEQDLMPRVICGSSVGSVTAAVVACAPYEEMEKMFDPNYTFKHPILGFKSDSRRGILADLLMGRIAFETQVIKDFIKRFSGELTFKEIFTKYGWNLNITVTDFSMTQTSRLLNYLSTPNVLVWSAVVASCAIPGAFEKAELM